MGKSFCRALVKFSEPATYRDALREVEERINGNTNPMSKSNFSMQLEARDKGIHISGTGGAAAQSSATATSSAANSAQMILVAGSIGQKGASSKIHTSAWNATSNGGVLASGLDSRHSQQVK